VTDPKTQDTNRAWDPARGKDLTALQKTLKNKDSFADGPGQAIGIFAGVDFPSDCQGFQVDDYDVVVGRACYEGALTVWLHQNARGAVAYGYAFHFLARGGIHHD